MKFRIVRYIKLYQDVIVEADNLDDAFEMELPQDSDWHTFDRETDITNIVEAH